MTPKDKAEQLVDKFTTTIFDSGCTVSKPMIISVSIIAVDEIIELVSSDESAIIVELQYWQQVRKELKAM